MYNLNGELTGVKNRLCGKTLLVIGDSFVEGHTLSESQTWAYKLADRNGMTCINKGINGASIAYSANEQYTSIVESIASIINSVSSADYVVVLAGHNDANADLHGGTAIPIGNDDDAANTTYKGALNIIIDALLDAYPTAHILLCAPFNRRGIEEDYAAAMETMAGIYSVPFFDSYHRSTICFQNTAQNTTYELENTLHLNEAGHERFSYIIDAQLQKI